MSAVSRGFIWSAAERFSIQGIGFLLSIIIARIVSPSAYGLIVMIQVFLSFSQLFIDSGFSNALIQKKNRTEIDYNTVFIFNFVVAVFLYLIMFIVAPLIAIFYKEPQLTNITRIISLNLILSSLSIVQKTRLTIELDYKTQTKAGIIAVAVSGIVGIMCAYSGWEVWALVVQAIISQTIISIALILYSKWTPKFQFSFSSFKGLFNYGSKLLGSNVLTSIYLNVFNLVIGKRYTSTDLAFYNRGFSLSQFPSTNIAAILDRVIFPVLTKFQDNHSEMIKAYFRYLRLSNYIILPIMSLLIILAPSLIEVILTSKWLPVVTYLRIFSLTYMCHAFIIQSSNIIAAIGNSGILLKYQFVKRGISFILLICTIGISVEVICWGILLNSLIEIVINLYLDKKELSISPLTQIKSQISILSIVLIMSIAVYLLKIVIDDLHVQLLAGFIIGPSIYVLLTYMFRLDETYIYTSSLTKMKTMFKRSQ